MRFGHGKKSNPNWGTFIRENKVFKPQIWRYYQVNPLRVRAYDYG
jgi:hypothetical protein